MSYYKKAQPEHLDQQQQEAAAYHEAHQGSMTNMKWTLLNHVPSFKAYMTWYDLRDDLLLFVTEREFSLFSYAISTTNDCLVCSTFFRRILIEDGDDPDNLVLSDTEQILWNLGQSIVKDPHAIPETVYERLSQLYSETQVIQLLAYAGMMVATNLFVTLAKIDLDEILYQYRKEEHNHE